MGKSLKAAPSARRPAPKKSKTFFATESTETTEKKHVNGKGSGAVFCSQFSLEDTPFYHCVSRTVRKALLCGVSHYSGNYTCLLSCVWVCIFVSLD